MMYTQTDMEQIATDPIINCYRLDKKTKSSLTVMHNKKQENLWRIINEILDAGTN
jgi:hypothetical protein